MFWNTVKRVVAAVAIGVLSLFVLVAVFVAYQFRAYLFDPRDSAEQPKAELFLEDVDFTDGDYAVVVQRRHDQPPVIIDDETALIENQSAVRLKTNHFLSFVPGEGGFGKAIYLFRDSQLVKSANPKAFSVFEVGSLEQFGRQVISQEYLGARNDYLTELRRLTVQPDVYVYNMAEPDPDGFEYRFTVHFPSIATNDEAFDTDEVGKRLYQRVQQALLGQRTDFRIDYPSAIGGSIHPMLLRDGALDDYPYIYDEEGSVLKLEGWTLYHYQLSFSATPQFYAAALMWDFEQYLDETLWVKAPLVAAIDRALAQSGNPTPRAHVGIVGYKNEINITEPKEKRYSLRYFEPRIGPVNEGR